MDLDVAVSQGARIIVEEVRSADGDRESVPARPRPAVVAGLRSVGIAQFLVHLGVAFERPTVARESHRRYAGVHAVHIDGAARRAVVVIGKRRIGLVILCDEPEVGGKTSLDERDAAASGDLLEPWRRWRRC